MSPIKEPCFFAPEVVELTPRAREIFTAGQPALQAYLDGPVREKREMFLGVDSSHPIDVSRRHNVTLAPRWPALCVVHSFRRAILRMVPPPIATRARVWYWAAPNPGPTARARSQVIPIYEQDVRALEPLIGRDLSGWLDPGRRAVACVTS